MRYQGYAPAALGVTDEPESSNVTIIERSLDLNPAIYIDCSNLPSLTRTEFTDECDINKLMAQYEKTGILPPSMMNTGTPRFLDVSNVPDLQTALHTLQDATAAFMALPAHIRRDFDNDALKFVDFAQKEENTDKLREWKLIEPLPEPEAPTRVEIVNAPEPPPREITRSASFCELS